MHSLYFKQHGEYQAKVLSCIKPYYYLYYMIYYFLMSRTNDRYHTNNIDGLDCVYT